ncbi:helicase associated domain-containing protein [Gordonia sp. GONU]|uniref:helicase associated domain-containing protein n=1 Tax=Gordonia TaxID=2053 RepID=UPI00096A96C8|nr:MULTISPECIES: helicase associated domain-containing protein [unclassified Gordonia (in: high G+C Gram-positive bacteria)]MCR8899818.1 helicase associated domain-containing protein [Gordonia sp. GONU]
MDPRIDRPETGCAATPSEDEAGSTSRGSAYDRLFDTGIAHLHRYVAMHGSSSPPRGATIDGFAIGQWVVNRRAEYRRGQLSPERIRRLDTEFPGWVWNVREAMFDVGVTHLRRYVAVHGTSNAGEGDVVNGFEIGTWVASRRADYRRGRLSAERIARLESEFPDWQWLPQDEAFAAAFETGLSHLRRYVAAHGTSQVPQRDVIDGFPIGTWVATRRADYRKGRLSAERIRRIETEFPDWRWTVRPAATSNRR